MRWLALAAAAALSLIVTAPARALPAGVSENVVSVPGAPAGTPVSFTVNQDGWTASILFYGVPCSNLTSAYSATPDGASPKGVLTIDSPGFDSSGVATRVTRTVWLTEHIRRPCFQTTTLTCTGQDLPNERNTRGGCLTRWSLSDFVNTSDFGTVSLLAGLYTSQGVASKAATLPVVNRSAWDHRIPTCGWVTPPHRIVGSGDSMVVEVACFHPRFQSQRQVAAVKLDVTDGTNHAYCTSSSMSDSAWSASGNPFDVFSCTYAAGAFSGLTSGSCASGASCEVTMDFTAYPFVGDRVLTASAGQDGVAIAASSRSPNLHAQNFVWDQAGSYAPIYGWVDLSGTCNSSSCISTSSTDPGTGASANFATFYKAANNCRSYNNSNRGHNDTSGCIIKIRAGTHLGYDPTTELNTLAAGIGHLEFQAAPGESNTTVVVSPNSGKKTTVKDRTWFQDIGFAHSDTTTGVYNEIILGTTTLASTLNEELVCIRCKFTPTTTTDWPMIYKIGSFYFYDVAMDLTAVNGSKWGLTDQFGGVPYGPMFFGGSITGHASGSSQLAARTVMGTVVTAMKTVDPAGTQVIPPTGQIIFNAAFLKMNNAAPFALTSEDHIAVVGNVFENIKSAAPAAQLWADNNTQNIYDAVVAYNTYAGGRRNGAYNEFPGDCYWKYVASLYEVVDPMSGQGWNIKTDTYDSGTNGDGRKVCNWNAVYGVGNIGNVFNVDANGVSTPGPDNFVGMYFGRTGSTTANNVGYGKSVSFTTNHSQSGDAAGSTTPNGYLPSGGAASPAYGRVPSGYAGLPHDILGANRRNDGTGCAGAIEC